MRVSQQWYQGTADAVYQNIYSIGSERSKFVFIHSGDHIYKRNYSRMLQQHGDSGADVTVGTIEIPAPQAAKQFGVIETDKDWRIIGFEEKPAVPKESPYHAGHCNASMGIYIFNTQLLIPILLADSEDPKSSHDFGKDILPPIIPKHPVFAYNLVNSGPLSRTRPAIIDPHVSLPERTEIGYDLEADRRRFHVSDSGIVVVVRQESLIEEPESA